MQSRCARLGLILAILLLGAPTGSALAQAAPPPAPPTSSAEGEPPADFEIPGGWFFTQAVPGRTDGRGFTVQNGHGARLWSAFEAQGGPTSLGYPVSTRFEWDGNVAQAFTGGVLRWDPLTEEAELLPVAPLPGGRPPRYAIQPELPPSIVGEASATPWSGWWWPSSDGVGPTLYAPGGPLAKYDQFMEAQTGENPGTRAWERTELYFPGIQWAGHCNGWAAAALIEAEPPEPREVLGITFTPGHLKGLLSSYHSADAAAWMYGGEETALSPADFHRQLLRWLAEGGKGFVVTFDLGRGEVWSYPAYRFESEWGLDPETHGRWRVTTRVWMADSDVRADFIGVKPYPRPEGQLFEYVLDGDPRDPTDGAWVGPSSAANRLARPGSIWYPEPGMRNVERELASPNLLIEHILAIQAAAEPNSTPEG